MEHEAVSRLAYAFGASVIVDGAGSDGTLRGEATRAGVPTVTVEMGEAHRFERPLIDDALDGVASVFAEYGLRDWGQVRWPGWRTVVTEKTWLRADAGGMVDMHYDRGALVREGDRVCTLRTRSRRTERQCTPPLPASSSACWRTRSSIRATPSATSWNSIPIPRLSSTADRRVGNRRATVSKRT